MSVPHTRTRAAGIKYIMVHKIINTMINDIVYTLHCYNILYK